MKRLFDLSNPIFSFLGRVCDLLLVNLATVFLCLLVIPSGAAVSALYSVTLKMVRGEERETVKSYLAALKENFTASTPATLLLLLDLGLLAVLYFAWTAETLVLSPAVFFLLCIVAVVITAVLSWLFPLLARYENRFSVHLANACRLSISRLPVTLLITAVHLLPFLCLLLPESLPYTACFWMLIGFAAGAYLNAVVLRRTFDTLAESQKGAKGEGPL